MTKPELSRLAVLGAGPIGLEAALYARRWGHPVTVYERGRVGEYVQRWGHVRLFTPFGMNHTPLGRMAILAEHPQHEFPADGDCITGREHCAAYLEPLAKTSELHTCLRSETQVLYVGRRGFLKDDDPDGARRGKQPFRILLRDKNQRESVEEADIVLDCTGTYGQHRWLGDGGIPAVGEIPAEQHIVYALDEALGERRRLYAGKNIAVVGSGYSAATTVCSLATLAEQHPDTWIIWLARGSSTQPIRRITGDSLRERDRLAVRANTLATRADANVEFHPQTTVEVIEFFGPDKGFKISGRCGGSRRTWEVDRIIANVGYSPDSRLYRELQIHESYTTFGPHKIAASLAGQATSKPTSDRLRNPEPNFYILGAKSYGRNSNFLLRDGFEQVRDVFALITGK